MNGIEDMDHFMDLCPDDLDQLNITEVDTRARIVAAISYALEESQTANAAPTFVRHMNGRVSLPPTMTGPIRGAPILHPHHQQIYENYSFFRDDYSSSSTDTSSGYLSRPPTTFAYPPPTSSASSVVVDPVLKDSYHAHVVQVEEASSSPSPSPANEAKVATSC